MTITDIAKELDLSILTDLSGDDVEHTWPIYYLGQPPEPGAGLYGFSASPYFHSIGELEAWATEHYKELYDEYVAPYVEVKP